MDPVRVVVVGAGHLGKYHLEKIDQAEGASLVAVVDTHGERRAQAASRFGVPGVERLEDLQEPCDAAIIATPTHTHSALGHVALDRGLHVLVEKPIASTVEESQGLVEHAQRQQRWLQVGHVERFNPAVAAALAIADRPRYIVAERLGRFTGRSTDIDVVLDLMIHDLDIVASLVDSPLAEVRAIGVPVLTDAVDMASARLAFADGTVAQLSAGRASLEPSRKIRLFTVERYVSIDCGGLEVKSVRRLPPEPGSDWPQIAAEPVEVFAGDALARQDTHFIECIRRQRPPRVDGSAGLRALQLAEAIKKEMAMPGIQPTEAS